MYRIRIRYPTARRQTSKKSEGNLPPREESILVCMGRPDTKIIFFLYFVCSVGTMFLRLFAKQNCSMSLCRKLNYGINTSLLLVLGKGCLATARKSANPDIGCLRLSIQIRRTIVFSFNFSFLGWLGRKQKRNTPTCPSLSREEEGRLRLELRRIFPLKVSANLNSIQRMYERIKGPHIASENEFVKREVDALGRNATPETK